MHTRPLITAFFTLALASCQVQNAVDTPKDETPKVDFDNLFGHIHPAHQWNLSRAVIVDVTSPASAQLITVCGTYCGCLYKFAEIDSPDAIESVPLCVPVDLDDLIAVVDGLSYPVKVGGSVDARDCDGTPIDVSSVDWFGWILAAECGISPDYDFNDLVARIELHSDGEVRVTPMCEGTTYDMWLHFYNGADDYIISPNANNGYAELTKNIGHSSAIELSWHNWYAHDDVVLMPGYTINTFGTGGAIRMEGRSVCLPASLVGAFSTSDVCLTAYAVGSNKVEYARPTYGFYVSVLTPNIDDLDKAVIDDESFNTRDVVISLWPSGCEPQLMLIPDATNTDSPEHHKGWRWPSERSRIDLVYPSFGEWVGDPNYVWSTSDPVGWDDRGAVIDKDGTYTFFGYYPR